MGKKLSTNQASTKISKDDKKKQQQLNTMIKILRPKVYITHSSDFKSLVQDLTGNGNNNHNSLVIIPPLSATPLASQPPPFIEIIEDEDYQHQHLQETTSPDFSIDVSSDNNTSMEEVAYTMMGGKTSYNDLNIYNDFTGEKISYNHFNIYNDYTSNILSYDSSTGADIIIPESLTTMLLEEECLQNTMENHHYIKEVPPYSDDLVSLSPPSSTSSDWQLEIIDPFINNFYGFDDACYNSVDIQKEQALYHQQEVCFFENIELLQW